MFRVPDALPKLKKRAPRGTKGDPESGPGENYKRAQWAERALQEFQNATRSDGEDVLCDLLGDIGHWCDRTGIDFQQELNRAARYYGEETAGTGTQFGEVWNA